MPRFSDGSVSGNRRLTQVRFQIDNPIAASAGAEKGFRPAIPESERSTLESKPPMAGPRMKPSPKAAPIIPIPLARSFSPVISATAAVATEMLPPMMPATTREMPNNTKLPAKTHTR